MPPSSPPLNAFERTNFFYGLLLDEQRLQKDHAYFNGKRGLLNRLTLGTGVVCGLDLRQLAGPPPAWTIDAGVAIDGLGRELVLAEPRLFDPAQPTDEHGRPAGPPLTGGTVEISLRYVELLTDLMPVLVPDCDGAGECAAGTIREGVMVVVRDATTTAPVAAPECTLPAFPVPPAAGLHQILAERLRQACPQPAADSSVPIARIDLGTNAVDTVAGRRLVYSNQVLYELIMCLASHIASAAPRVLRYVSGDGQSGPAASTLSDPLVVELVDALNNPTSGETVQFIVTSGGGTVAAASVVTTVNGRAISPWTLGPAGAQQVTATAAETAFAVTFRATSV